MALDPTAPSKALLFLDGCRIFAVEQGTKIKDVFYHHDADLTLEKAFNSLVSRCEFEPKSLELVLVKSSCSDLFPQFLPSLVVCYKLSACVNIRGKL